MPLSITNSLPDIVDVRKQIVSLVVVFASVDRVYPQCNAKESAHTNCGIRKAGRHWCRRVNVCADGGIGNRISSVD